MIYIKYLKEDLKLDKLKDIDADIKQTKIELKLRDERIKKLQKLIKDIKSGKVKVVEDPKTGKPIVKRQK